MAQELRLDIEDAPLSEALTSLEAQSGVNFVYGRALVDAHRVTCRYIGGRVEKALECLLADTPLEAQRVHRRQFVIAPALQTPLEGTLPSADLVVEGWVRDAQSNEPLPNAHLLLERFQRGTTTDTEGFFRLKVPPGTSIDLKASYLGYADLDTTIVYAKSKLELALHPVALTAPHVLIEARGDEALDRVVLPGLTAMDDGGSGVQPALSRNDDLLHALQWMPGVERGGGINSGMRVRGGNDDQNLYLLEGAPIYHPWHAFNLISTFQRGTFQEYTLFRGAFPAQHGGRLSSVLEAHLKDGNVAEPQVDAGLSLLNGRFVIESPITKDISFMLSGRRSYLDKIIGQEHPVTDISGARDTLRTGYYFADVAAKVSARVHPNHRFSFAYYNGRDVLDLRLPFDVSLDWSSWLKPADLFFEVDQRWGNRIYSMQYQWVLAPRFLINTTLFRSSYGAVEGNLVQPSTSSQIQTNYRVRLRDLGGRLDASWQLLTPHFLQAGLHVTEHDFLSTLDTSVQRAISSVDSLSQSSSLAALESAFYIQDTWTLSEKWTLQSGLRLSYFSSGQYFHLNPRISMQYRVHPEYLTLRASGGRQVQYMQQLRDRHSFMYDLVSSRWIPTDERIQPSRGLQFSIEAESTPLSWLSLDAEAYWRKLDEVLLPRDEFQIKDDIVGPGIEVGSLLAQYVSGLGRAYGAEIRARAAWGGWRYWLMYAGGRSLSRSPSLDEIAFRSTRFDVPRTLRAAVSRGLGNWEFTMASIARSGYPITVPLARYTIEGPLGDEPIQYLHRPHINNGRLPAYFRLDLTASYQFSVMDAPWSIQLHLFNVTNRRNIIGRFYDPEQPVVVATDRRGLPLLPLLEIDMKL